MRKQKRRVYVDGVFLEMRLDSSGKWFDPSGRPYKVVNDKFVRVEEEEKWSWLVPEGVTPEYGKIFVLNGIVYQFQPKGPKGELIPVPVAKVINPVLLGLADGTRSRVPATPIRAK